MHLFSLLLPLLAAVGPTLSHPSLDSRAITNCVKGVHILALRGKGLKVGNLGKLQSLVGDIRQAIPHSDFVDVAYPTHPGSLINLTAIAHDVPKGQVILTKEIEQYVAACPDVPLVLLGYSEGAEVVMNTLCGASSAIFVPNTPIASSYATNVLATIVYGDETRAAAQPYNLGTCETVGTIVRLLPQDCAPFEASMQSYCDSQDPDCCIGGMDKSQHFVYPFEYNTNATAFVVERYKALKKGTL